MANISLKFDTSQARKQIAGLRDQVPFATRITLNELARNTKTEIDKQIKSRIDRPKRYTLRAIHTENSKPGLLRSVVKVGDRAVGGSGKTIAQTLGHLFRGGERKGKNFEGAFRGLNVLPAGMYIVPGPKAPIDAFGNIRRSTLRKLITYFKNNKPNGVNASGLAPGVYIRKFDRKQKRTRKQAGKEGNQEIFVIHKQVQLGSRPKGKKQRPPEPILLFVDEAKYRQYFDMQKTAVMVVTRDADAAFERNYENALKTAKPIK